MYCVCPADLSIGAIITVPEGDAMHPICLNGSCEYLWQKGCGFANGWMPAELFLAYLKSQI